MCTPNSVVTVVASQGRKRIPCHLAPGQMVLLKHNRLLKRTVWPVDFFNLLFKKCSFWSFFKNVGALASQHLLVSLGQ